MMHTQEGDKDGRLRLAAGRGKVPDRPCGVHLRLIYHRARKKKEEMMRGALFCARRQRERENVGRKMLCVCARRD